ncbi:hypothetical protein [Rhizobium sp. SG2393]|uniref:hypothetical protein n=1 Tax=Rhizobium sp. SG2393 TaxID=3276279 RepID=UPI00366B1BBF
MIWLLFAIPAVVIVYLAARFSRFRHIAEPVVSVIVALGLIVAATVWWIDEARKPAADIEPPGATSVNAAAERANLSISNLEVTESRPAGVFHAKGIIANGTARMTDYIRLSVVLQDCAANPCRRVGEDTPLLLLSILPGESKSFETYVTVRPGVRPVARPEWSATITDARLSDP